MKSLILTMAGVLLLSFVALTLMGQSSGCEDADIASRNISKAADNFEVFRRIVFYNGITGDYMLTIEGKCAILDQGNQLEVVVKHGHGDFSKHFLGLSDNISYFAEQIHGVDVSTYHYRVTFKPQTILPDIDFRGDVQEAIEVFTEDSSDINP